jgi:hypothetical protein
MKTKRLLSLFLFLAAFLYSCNHPQIPAELKTAFAQAKDNASELSKVLDYYSTTDKDSLKKKAAIFLIKNLSGRYYFDGKLLQNYVDYPNFILRDRNHGEYILNSFNKLYGPYNQDSLDVKIDLQEVKANQLISNIDAAFDAWHNHSWGKNYSFEQFCNYILPFRIGDEVPSYNRMAIYLKFDSLLKANGKQSIDAVEACKLINKQLIEDGWVLSNRVSYLPNYNANTVINYRVGSCREMVDLGIYVMRSVGIPVTFDFLPSWPYRRQGHSWDVVIAKNGKAIPFLAGEDSPGTPHRPGTTRGKVYRTSFVQNPFSLAKIASPNEPIPSFLRNPYISDVTEQYAKIHSLELPFNIKANRFAYLAVYNDIDWQPIAWAKVVNSRAVFTKVEGGIVYLPTYFSASGLFPSDNPFILNEQGNIRYLNPDTSKRIDKMVCSRVYPIVAESYTTDMVTGGKIEGANSRDFSDTKTLFVFKERALPGLNDVILDAKAKYRYIRFISSKKNRYSLAEFSIYNGTKKIPGKPFAQDTLGVGTIKNVADEDSLTFFTSAKTAAWIAFDLGKAVTINHIKLMSKIDVPNNHLIVPGKKYTLKYWLHGTWSIVDSIQAKTKTLTFRRVPSNALFLLTSDSEVKDMRIFTYEHNKQMWW